MSEIELLGLVYEWLPRVFVLDVLVLDVLVFHLLADHPLAARCWQSGSRYVTGVL